MQPNSNPTPEDVASVAAHLDGQQPAPQAAQPEMQPEAPTPQAAPTQQPTDPFATLFASEPATPTEPAPTEPTQPTEPMTPQPQQPTEPIQPTPQEPASQPQVVEDDYQSYDDYMKEVLANVPQVPAQPDPEQINPEDPAAIKGFFDDLMSTAEQRFEASHAKKQAIQSAEKRVWDEAFDKYGSLKENKPLRDMVHSIRMGYFQRGVALSPTQAADRLLASMGQQYKQGVADQNVVTTYESVQPNSGGSGAPVETTLDRDNVLEAVQTGGEAALAQILDAQIKAGKTW